MLLKTCMYKGCDKYPVFGEKGTNKREYCKDHAPINYVDVVNKKCKYTGCVKHPTFGKLGTKCAEYCKEHCPFDYVDVLNKKCLHSECDTQPRYGYSGYSPEYCAKHRTPRMVLYPKNKEKEEEKNCSYCGVIIHYNEEYCSGCKRYLELGTTVRTHEKELHFKKLLDELEIKYINDKEVKGGISRKRPDYQIPTSWGTIIVEVDEFQHKKKDYSCECEITRMKQL